MTQMAHDRCQEFLTNKEFGLAMSEIVARNETEGELKKKGEKMGGEQCHHPLDVAESWQP